MTATTRSESALVRPFAGIAEADTALEKVRLLINRTEHEAGAVVLPDEVLATAQLAVRLPSADDVREQVEKTVVPKVDCGLVIMATARTHRVSKVFVQDYLRIADWSEELSLKRSDADLILNDRAGFVLTVAIVLLNDLAPEPLRPHMAGTWLARREFKVSPELDETSFSPEELTEEVRKFHKLPKDVLRYVHVEGVLEEETLSDAVHVYLDSEVLHLLLANPTEPSAVQMQIELAIQATETVAVAIAQDLVVGGTVATTDTLDGHPAAKRFYENLARTLDVSVAEALEFATNRAAVLRAHLESAFKMRAATSAALREK